jgi:asparagine synthase (glutamine-hydrolysing)
VKLRMRADVPVGVLLSGGLDSTSIICSMARDGAACPKSAHDLNAFCYMSPQFDETRYIDATLSPDRAQSSGACLTNHASCGTSIERHMWFQDEPVHSFTSVVGYQLMRDGARTAASRFCSTARVPTRRMAGYPSYFPEYWADLIHGRPLVAAGCRRVRGYGRAMVASGQRATPSNAATRRSADWRTDCLVMQRHRSSAVQARSLRNEWVSDDVKHAWTPCLRPHPPSLIRSLQHSLEHEPLPLYLRVEDSNSMAHGVEVRLPFMDYRLVSLAFRLGAQWKLHNEYGKFVLRQAMRERIPEIVRTRGRQVRISQLGGRCGFAIS